MGPLGYVFVGDEDGLVRGQRHGRMSYNMGLTSAGFWPFCCPLSFCLIFRVQRFIIWMILTLIKKLTINGEKLVHKMNTFFFLGTAVYS